MKILFVGDPHATPDSLGEMSELIGLIVAAAEKHRVDAVCFLGDLYHTHSLVHLPVMAFWDRAFKIIATSFPVLTLVGNHDKSGVKGQIENALMLHDTVKVFASPEVWNGILFVPYVHDPEEFVQICQQYPAVKTVVCHQTFAGSIFENGFMVPDGVEPNLLPQEQVISGHIHMPQTLGKVWYPGSPRWRSVSDANTDRAIWAVELDGEGLIKERQSEDTAGACTPIYVLSDTPAGPVEIPPGRCKVVVDIYGPMEHVAARKRYFEAQDGVRVRSFPDADKTVKVKESDGLHAAFRKFVVDFKPKHSTPAETLFAMAQERISWLKNIPS